MERMRINKKRDSTTIDQQLKGSTFAYIKNLCCSGAKYIFVKVHNRTRVHMRTH